MFVYVCYRSIVNINHMILLRPKVDIERYRPQFLSSGFYNQMGRKGSHQELRSNHL